MILLFALKLVVWNFIHSMILGMGMVLPGALAVLVGKRSEAGGKAVVGVTLLLLTPLVLLLPVMSGEAVRASLAADQSRWRWAWWLVAWLLAMQPLAVARERIQDSEAGMGVAVMTWMCRAAMLATVFIDWPLPSFLERLANALAVK